MRIPPNDLCLSTDPKATGFRVKVLQRGMPEVNDLLDLLESGVQPALAQHFLLAFTIAILLDPQRPSQLVESYTLSFDPQSHGETSSLSSLRQALVHTLQRYGTLDCVSQVHHAEQQPSFHDWADTLPDLPGKLKLPSFQQLSTWQHLHWTDLPSGKDEKYFTCQLEYAEHAPDQGQPFVFGSTRPLLELNQQNQTVQHFVPIPNDAGCFDGAILKTDFLLDHTHPAFSAHAHSHSHSQYANERSDTNQALRHAVRLALPGSSSCHACYS